MELKFTPRAAYDLKRLAGKQGKQGSDLRKPLNKNKKHLIYSQYIGLNTIFYG